MSSTVVDFGKPKGDPAYHLKIDLRKFFPPINFKKMNKNKIPHIGLDIETLSLRPTACITSIAAKTFSFDGTIDEEHSFDCCVDATSCAMYGLTFEQRTVNWWAGQSDDAKRYFLDTPAIKLKEALQSLAQLYRDVQAAYNCQRVLVWVQGSDYDIAVLRNAYRQVFEDDEKAIPWPHDCVRDARTYILSNLNLLHSVGFFNGFDPAYNPERPYDVLPKRPGWVKHQADSDVLQMVWNIKCVTDFLLEALPVQQ